MVHLHFYRILLHLYREGGQEAATFALLSVLEGEEKKSTLGQISKYSPSKYLIKQRGGDQKA